MKNVLIIICFTLLFSCMAAASDNPCEKKYRQIRANAMISGELKKKRSVNYYKIALKREGKLTASVRNLRDTHIEIVDGLCFDIPERGSDTSKAATLGAGDWFLKVYSPRGVTGKYDLYVRFKPGETAGDMEAVMGASALPENMGESQEYRDDCGHSPELRLGSSISERFRGPRDTDVFHINLTRPTQLTVWSTGKADTKAVLKDSDCRPIFRNSDHGKDSNFLITAGLRPGKYFICVTRESGRAKNYVIHAKGEPLKPSGHPQYQRKDINLSGTWNWTRTGISNTLGLPMNTLKGSVVFQQKGKNVQIIWSKKYSYNGSVNGNVLVFHRTFKNGGSRIRERLEITFRTPSRGSGEGNWTIRNDKISGSGVYRYHFVKTD